MGIVLAQRFYGLLVAIGAIAAALAAIFPQRVGPTGALWLLLGADGCLLGLALWDALSARRHRVAIRREPLERLSIGRDNAVTLTVTPQSRQRRYDLQIRDTYPPSMAATAMPLLATATSDTTQLTYTVRPDRRGEVTWGNIYLQQRGPWKLAWHSWQVPQAETTAVYPDLLGLRALSVRLALQATGALRQTGRSNAGTEFSELRDYAAGDDPRLIDWKATARRGQPLVRVMEPEKEQTAIILLDRGRLMTARVAGQTRFDWGLNAALSLALAALSRGDRVGIGVFDRQIHTWIPPQRGPQIFPRLVERLATIEPELLESDYPSAIAMLATQQHRRALVVLLTDIVDATASTELLAALARLRPRYLPLCVALGDPAVRTRATTPTTDVRDAYTRAVALDLLAQRQAAFARLQQKGVLVLDAPANAISESLVDRYLRVKAQNQL